MCFHGPCMRGVRGVALVIAGLLSAVTGGIAAWSLSRTMADLRDPCVRWDPPGGVAVAPEGCRSITVHGQSQGRAAAVALLVPGGLLVSVTLAAAGMARRNRGMMRAGAALMLAETAVVFTIAPLTLAAGLALAAVAWTMPARERGDPARG